MAGVQHACSNVLDSSSALRCHGLDLSAGGETFALRAHARKQTQHLCLTIRLCRRGMQLTMQGFCQASQNIPAVGRVSPLQALQAVGAPVLHGEIDCR